MSIQEIGMLFQFIGGLGMFLYGMNAMADGLQRVAGSRLQKVLQLLTTNRLLGVLVGAGVTAIIQSSSATTVMVVGFVNAGIMNLTQAMGVIMGANIGTTVTGWLVSAVEWAEFLSPSKLAPIAVILGVILMLTGKRKSSKEIANIIIGFGLLFIGITNMSSAVEPLKEVEAFTNLFVTLGKNPLLGILAGTVVTGVIQSSSASVGILQSLAAVGLVPFNAAIYIIMGQNIGTCVTAMMSSIGAKKNAKTAALMHLLFNIMGTIVFSIIAIIYFQVIAAGKDFGNITQTQISIVHTAFNIATTLMLFPASDWIIKLAKKINKIEENEQDRGDALLDDRMLETPVIAIQRTVAEAVRMGEIVEETLDVVKRVVYTKEREDITKIKDDEQTVDKLCGTISDYAIRLGSLQISEQEHQSVARLLQVLSDVERVSDHCENVSEYAETMIEKKIEFSEIAREHLDEIMKEAVDSYKLAIEAFAVHDQEKARLVIEKERRVDALELDLRNKHIKRLSSNQCSAEAGVLFLDILVAMERISDHARNIAEEVLI